MILRNGLIKQGEETVEIMLTGKDTIGKFHIAPWFLRSKSEATTSTLKRNLNCILKFHETKLNPIDGSSVDFLYLGRDLEFYSVIS